MTRLPEKEGLRRGLPRRLSQLGVVQDLPGDGGGGGDDDDGDGDDGDGDGHPCQPCAGQQGRAQRRRAAESTFHCMGGNLRWMSTAGLVSFFSFFLFSSS